MSRSCSAKTLDSRGLSIPPPELLRVKTSTVFFLEVWMSAVVIGETDRPSRIGKMFMSFLMCTSWILALSSVLMHLAIPQEFRVGGGSYVAYGMHADPNVPQFDIFGRFVNSLSVAVYEHNPISYRPNNLQQSDRNLYGPVDIHGNETIATRGLSESLRFKHVSPIKAKSFPIKP